MQLEADLMSTKERLCAIQLLNNDLEKQINAMQVLIWNLIVYRHTCSKGTTTTNDTETRTSLANALSTVTRLERQIADMTVVMKEKDATASGDGGDRHAELEQQINFLSVVFSLHSIYTHALLFAGIP
jgi:hypothetical protein